MIRTSISPESAHKFGHKKAYTIAIIALAILSLIPIWSAEYFPSQNGPAYLLIIHMFKEFHNPAFNYSDYYELRPFISPYLLFNLIVYLLHFIFSLLISEKIGLSIYAILLPLSVFYFLKIANPGKMYLGFVSFLYIYNFFLFRGYFNFCLAIPIFFFCFGYWLNHKENLTLARIVILNVLAKQIKRRSPIPQMGHEHTPNREAVLMGVDVKINSQGLRDYEYPISKAENTFRILVLGDSMTLGWGAPFEQTYPKVLERMLNENHPVEARQAPDDRPGHGVPYQRYEVINAGVGNYNTVQEVAYFKARGILYNPDMVLLGFYLNDAEEVPKPSTGFLREHSYFYVLLSAGWDALLRAVGWRKGYKDYYLELYSDTNKGWKACQAALEELIRLCQEKQIELRIIIIPELHSPNAAYAFGKVHTLIRQIGSQHHVPVIDLLPAFKGVHPPSLWVSLGDPHPSAKAHEIIAKALYDKEWGNQGAGE